MMHEGGCEGGAEAVVDVDYRHVGGAGVEHGQERGEAGEVGAVADGGGDGEDGAGDQAADNAGECAFHAGDGDDGAAVLESGDVGEEAVKAGNADVGDGNGWDGHGAEGDECFGGDGGVTRAGRYHRDWGTSGRGIELRWRIDEG